MDPGNHIFNRYIFPVCHLSSSDNDFSPIIQCRERLHVSPAGCYFMLIAGTAEVQLSQYWLQCNKMVSAFIGKDLGTSRMIPELLLIMNDLSILKLD